jgi:hypothetical protein
MSLTLTLTGTSSVLTASHFPALDLSDDEYELGLTTFETYNSIPNVTSANNRFHFGEDDRVIVVPEGSYELRAVSRYLRAALLHRERRAREREKTRTDGAERAREENRTEKDDEGDDDGDGYGVYEDDGENKDGDDRTILALRANENTMRSEIKCAYRVNFAKPNSIGSLLGFSRDRILRPNKWYVSDRPVDVMSVNVIRIECSITTGAYSNGRSVHAIHEFAPKVPPGYKLSETPTQIIYLPIVARYVTDITVRVVDQNDRLIDFRGEEITIRLHVRRRS